MIMMVAAEMDKSTHRFSSSTLIAAVDRYVNDATMALSLLPDACLTVLIGGQCLEG